MSEEPLKPAATPPAPTMDVVTHAPAQQPAAPKPTEAKSEQGPVKTEATTKTEAKKPNRSPKPVGAIIFAILVASSLIALAVYAQLQKS